MGVLKVFVYFVSYQNSTEVKKKKGGVVKKKGEEHKPTRTKKTEETWKFK